jgi:phenylalanyl-tRNA synthetase alpha chain
MTQPEHNLVTQVGKTAAEFKISFAGVKQSGDDKALEDLRIEFLGRKGKLTVLFENLKDVPKEERPQVGKVINELRGEMESSINALKQTLATAKIASQLRDQAIDISLPTNHLDERGSLHPVTLMRRELLDQFRRMGFTVYDGPEIDLDFYNFSALNFSEHHPARDMHDTFFVKNFDKTVLRTHTSNIQIHAMLNEKPPLKIVAPGRTFRCDSDITHTPMFHQIEAFVVDQNISFAHLKGVIDLFLKAIYGSDLKTRLRPSYFPFVEPGAEVDMQCVSCRGKGCRICKETGWLEIGGCGMIHPNVFEAVGYDSESYTGFAFGFGIDRMAMLKYSLPDLRQLFEGNYEFLNQFPILS